VQILHGRQHGNLRHIVPTQRRELTAIMKALLLIGVALIDTSPASAEDWRYCLAVSPDENKVYTPPTPLCFPIVAAAGTPSRGKPLIVSLDRLLSPHSSFGVARKRSTL
jgi:hypothetical protein